MTDRHFRVPSMRLAELHAAHTPATYTYLFTWKSPGWDGKLGAGHEVNTPFVFGTLDAPDSLDLVPAGSPVGELPTQMQDAWIAFARTGSPRTAASAALSPCTKASLVDYVIAAGDSNSKVGQTTFIPHRRKLVGAALLKLKGFAFIRFTQEQIAITDEGRRFLNDLELIGFAA